MYPYTNRLSCIVKSTLSCIVKSTLSWIDLYVYLLYIYLHFIYSNVASRPQFDYCDYWIQHVFFNTIILVKEEEIDETNEVIRIRKSKYRQHIHQKKRAKKNKEQSTNHYT